VNQIVRHINGKKIKQMHKVKNVEKKRLAGFTQKKINNNDAY